MILSKLLSGFSSFKGEVGIKKHYLSILCFDNCCYYTISNGTKNITDSDMGKLLSELNEKTPTQNDLKLDKLFNSIKEYNLKSLNIFDDGESRCFSLYCSNELNKSIEIKSHSLDDFISKMEVLV